MVQSTSHLKIDWQYILKQVLPTTSLVYLSHESTWDIRRTVDGKPGHHSNLNVLNQL